MASSVDPMKPPRLTGWTPAQQGKIRPVVDEAWARHARDESIDPKDKAARRAWYEATLFAATGKRSSKDCDRGDDFDDSWAAFEAIAATNFEGQIAQATGRLKRVRFLMDKARTGSAREFSTDAALAAWLLGIARQSGHPAESIAEIPGDNWRTIRRAAIIAAKRGPKFS